MVTKSLGYVFFSGFWADSVIGKSAMQRCPCGFYTDPMKECTCASVAIQKYMAKISGPLMDALHIEVPAVRYRELATRELEERSSSISERVIAAREIQTRWFTGHKHLFATPTCSRMRSGSSPGRIERVRTVEDSDDRTRTLGATL
jgi:hypothetical protein